MNLVIVLNSNTPINYYFLEYLNERNFEMQLSEAVEADHYESVKSLLEQSPNLTAEDLAKALRASVDCKDLKIVQLLIDNGAEINYVAPNRMPILLWAVEQQRPDIIKLFAENGADLNIQDSAGNTALHIALDIEMVTASEWIDPPEMNISKLLYKLGADPTVQDNRGNSSIDISRNRNFQEALNLFSKR